MKAIMVYDTEADRIEEFAERNNMGIAEVIEILIDDYLKEMAEDNGLEE